MKCDVSTYQLVSLVLGICGGVLFLLLLRALRRSGALLDTDRLLEHKAFLAGLFLLSVRQVYEGVFPRSLQPVEFKMPLILIFISAIFAIRSLRKKNID